MIKCIEDLELSIRTYNCLKRGGINFVHQLVQMSDDEILTVKRMGQKGLKEIRRVLSDY